MNEHSAFRFTARWPRSWCNWKSVFGRHWKIQKYLVHPVWSHHCWFRSPNIPRKKQLTNLHDLLVPIHKSSLTTNFGFYSFSICNKNQQIVELFAFKLFKIKDAVDRILFGAHTHALVLMHRRCLVSQRTDIRSNMVKWLTYQLKWSKCKFPSIKSFFVVARQPLGRYITGRIFIKFFFSVPISRTNETSNSDMKNNCK